jgi:thiamine biosynthesis protein ThiS
MDTRDSTDRIAVQLNGKPRHVEAGLTVKELVESLGLNPALVVVELNREILSRSRYGAVGVQDGDTIELVHFVGGG